MTHVEASAIEDWYQRYGPMVLRRCRWMLRDEELAMDVTQDVFVRVLREGPRLEVQTPSALLLRIATRLSLNRLRTRRRKPEDAEEELLVSIASSEDPESRTLAKTVLRRLFGEQETTQTMAVMHWVDGLTLEEVAEQTGYSVSGVRKRLRQLQNQVRGLEAKVAA